MDWAKPCRFLKGSIWLVVFTFIIVFGYRCPATQLYVIPIEEHNEFEKLKKIKKRVNNG